MKKLLLLGGSRYLLPVIKAAHELNIYTITCDYLPENIAHKYSDQYCNISILDKDAVLQAAEILNIDGIMSFACDPGVVTAAYVAEKLGLPHSGSYESVSILQNKGRFRKFLADHNFNVPMAKGYYSISKALADIDLYHWPVIVKPIDSAGSKGVTRVDKPAKLREGIEYALSFSHCNGFIVEDFLEKKGHSSDSDCFSVDGELKFVSFSAQRFDEKNINPYIPSAFSWPATISSKNKGELTREIQRLLKLLGMKTSIYNIETRECNDGKAYIMECSPRGGGNRLAELLRYSTGVDLIENAVLAAVGEPISIKQKSYNGFFAEIILHGDRRGIFEKLWISDEIEEYIIEKDLWIEEGTEIEEFSGADKAIGTLVLKFPTLERLNHVLDNQYKYIQILLKSGGGAIDRKIFILCGISFGKGCA